MELTEEIRIGTVHGADDYTFGQIEDLTVGPGGSIYVADLHPQSVIQFDRRGRLVRRIGREGGGPGEYRSIVGISMLPNGRLALWDHGNRRITIYDSSGSYVSGFRVPAGAYAREAFQTDTLGTLYVKIRTVQRRTSRQGPLPAETYAFLKVSSDGSVLDTISLPAENPTGTFMFIGVDGVPLRPFPVQETYALSPLGYLVIGSNERYSLLIRDPNGPVLVEKGGFERLNVKREERREWRALAEYNERASGISFPPIPVQKPAFRALWIDSDGRIWVHRYVEAVKRDLPEHQRTRSGALRPNITWQEPSVFDVYTNQGEFLWSVELPFRSRQYASRGLFVWGIVRGSLDEEYVVRWRISCRSTGQPPG